MKDHLIQLLDYELWANQRIIDALASLPNVPERALSLMSHILAAQHIWYARMANESAILSVWEEFPVSWMIETAERQHRQLVSYVEILSQKELSQPVNYVNSKHVPYTSTRLDILTHLSHHTAYHRGQIVQLIRPLLPDAPVTDYIVWTREGFRGE